MEEVSEKCWSFEAPAYVAVSFFLCLSPNFLLPINCEKGFQFCCLCTYGRFNEHLGKKGISGHINVDYKNEVLSVEVSSTGFPFPVVYLYVYRYAFKPV